MYGSATTLPYDPFGYYDSMADKGTGTDAGSDASATNQANDWGVHDLYGIRPHEDAYGRPILTARDVWHPY